ncbi:hypothetical protein ACLOJK_020779 [Asimina triloba]
MKPEKRARRARGGWMGKTLRPTERMFKAAELPPLEMKVKEGRESVSDCSIYKVGRSPSVLSTRHLLSPSPAASLLRTEKHLHGKLSSSELART